MSRVGRVLPYLLAAAALAWVARDLHLDILLGQLQATAWEWLGLAVLADTAGYLCAAWRWLLLLRPAPVSALRTAQAIYAGLFANEVVPGHVGELVRAYLVARWTGRELVAVLPTILVERFFDALWLAGGIGLLALALPLPAPLRRGGEIFAAGLVLLAALAVWLVRRPPGWAQTGRRLNRLGAGWMRLAGELRRLGASPATAAAFGLSLACLTLQILAFWLVMPACGLWLSPWQGMLVLFAVRLGTLVPSAPGNVGTYQFFCVAGLTMLGVEKHQAAGFSVVVFAVLTTPLWLIGCWALQRSGLSLSALRAEFRQWRAGPREGAAAVRTIPDLGLGTSQDTGGGPAGGS